MREKSWQRLPGFGDEREVWAKRALRYWTLQGRKYGIMYDVHGIELIFWDNEPVITSRCRIVGIIPGERVSDKRWRERNPPGQLIAELDRV